MADSNFIDYVKFCSRSGAGGAGSVHFRREKHVPKGGPDGGDGGRGGNIILRGNAQHWTLLHLKYKKHVIAEDGKGGEGGRRKGRDGEDIILEVPLGTVAKDAETMEPRFEITENGQEVILTPGGRGGLGNDHFKTATNQAPHYAQPGEPGIEEWIVLELKLLADVGLVGFPNAGKSTLLSSISAAKPEIGDYPFTTLVPNLGVIPYRNDRSFVMADIPGIIEGAAEGKGLGLRFLRHIERNSILLFMIPADTESISAQYKILLGELGKYNPELLDKKRLLAITKADMLDDELMTQMMEDVPDELPSLFISSVSQFNLDRLKDMLWQAIIDG
ncbi:GTP-binding protein Obg [Indibacter alkaliphilus LW1]|uniref:GTPase Obg n=1 Tax=Indibacter alkaliphilus (strain CCUG 57479 / KCTC 22604 / LW1) TaxID=1189612 RepID=S2DL95_INDAL|nr:GTPase ObgE [Indibacter alkaliphilus]EOZ99722.1 GTP-binding protein Obg [Indibacter alkaliphilus LW1]